MAGNGEKINPGDESKNAAGLRRNDRL